MAMNLLAVGALHVADVGITGSQIKAMSVGGRLSMVPGKDDQLTVTVTSRARRFVTSGFNPTDQRLFDGRPSELVRLQWARAFMNALLEAVEKGTVPTETNVVSFPRSTGGLRLGPVFFSGDHYRGCPWIVGQWLDAGRSVDAVVNYRGDRTATTWGSLVRGNPRWRAGFCLTARGGTRSPLVVLKLPARLWELQMQLLQRGYPPLFPIWWGVPIEPYGRGIGGRSIEGPNGGGGTRSACFGDIPFGDTAWSGGYPTQWNAFRQGLATLELMRGAVRWTPPKEYFLLWEELALKLLERKRPSSRALRESAALTACATFPTYSIDDAGKGNWVKVTGSKNKTYLSEVIRGSPTDLGMEVPCAAATDWEETPAALGGGEFSPLPSSGSSVSFPCRPLAKFWELVSGAVREEHSDVIDLSKVDWDGLQELTEPITKDEDFLRFLALVGRDDLVTYVERSRPSLKEEGRW